MIDYGALDAFLEQYIEAEKIPGAAVCLRRHGQVAFAKGYGKRNADGDRPDANTIFGIASMSKGLTCAAIALLEAEGRLSWYDRADKFFPKLVLPGVPRESLLLHHLATHTSGLPPLPLLDWSLAWHNPVERFDDEKRREKARQISTSKVETLDDIIDYIAAGDYKITGQPGEYLSYSNDAFALLSGVVDIAAGMTLEEFLEKRLFRPLDMERTVLDLDGSSLRRLGNVTKIFNQTGKDIIAADNWDIAPPYRGAGWVKSTPSDMARFYEMLCQDGEFEGRQILPPGAAQRMYGARFAESPLDSIYGYGLEKRMFGEQVIVEHAGGLTGVSTKGGFVKGSEGFASAAFCNIENAEVSPILNALHNTQLGLPPETSHFPWPIHPDGPAEPAAYVGTFRSNESPDQDVYITLEEGRLFFEEKGGDGKLPLRFCGRTCFVAGKEEDRPDRGKRFIFHVGADGRAKSAQVYNRLLDKIE